MAKYAKDIDIPPTQAAERQSVPASQTATNQSRTGQETAEQRFSFENMQPPERELALNLADIGHQANFIPSYPDAFYARLAYVCDDTAARFNRDTIDRIYVGSYFCDRFFLSLAPQYYEAIAAFCGETGIALTLVIPLFGQETLSAGHHRIDDLLALRQGTLPLFDEIVVNDPAMAKMFAEQYALRQESSENMPRLIYGRMMAKSPRDPRHAVLSEKPWPYALDAMQAQSLKARFGYAMAECDPATPLVDATSLQGVLPLALHLPHCFMTTGHICEAASADSPVYQKFRADMPCHQQCLSCCQVYEHHDYDRKEPRWFTRFGRTIFFENPRCELVGAVPQRIVWTPADFICQQDSPYTQTPFYASPDAFSQTDYYAQTANWPGITWNTAFQQGDLSWE